MGMYLGLLTLRDDNISKILDSPPLIWRVLSPDDPEIYLYEVNSKKSGIISRWFGKKLKDVNVPSLDFVEGEGIDYDLDKSWHGIHYLLTQTEWEGEPPLNFLLAGEVVGDIDVGYGPARVFSSIEVKEIYNVLQGIDHESLKNRYDPDDMMTKEIYPTIWMEEQEDGLDYCLQYFDDLKSFISEAFSHNLGIVLYLR